MMNSTISIEVDKNATVLQMKQKIKEQTNAEEADQKLIYKGLDFVEGSGSNNVF